MQWLFDRLAEHSTQVVLTADFIAAGAYFNGQLTGAMLLSTVIATIPAILWPSK